MTDSTTLFFDRSPGFYPVFSTAFCEPKNGFGFLWDMNRLFFGFFFGFLFGAMIILKVG
jgi:hypothetical protein